MQADPGQADISIRIVVVFSLFYFASAWGLAGPSLYCCVKKICRQTPGRQIYQYE